MSTPMRVLVVEDQEELRDLLADVMKDMGMDVRVAGTGDEAMALLRDGYTCEVLFSDVHMPGATSGAELAAFVARQLPLAMVILASGHPRFQLPALPERAHFLQKPFRLAQFLELVRGGAAVDAPVPAG